MSLAVTEMRKTWQKSKSLQKKFSTWKKLFAFQITNDRDFSSVTIANYFLLFRFFPSTSSTTFLTAEESCQKPSGHSTGNLWCFPRATFEIKESSKILPENSQKTFSCDKLRLKKKRALDMFSSHCSRQCQASPPDMIQRAGKHDFTILTRWIFSLDSV